MSGVCVQGATSLVLCTPGRTRCVNDGSHVIPMTVEAPRSSSQARVLIVTVVGWKLFDPAHEHRLSCLAEELALHAIVSRAEAVLEEGEEEPVDFSPLECLAFEDMDFLTLFDPSLDGVEETSTGKYLRMTNLKLREWFEPFNPDRGDAVHPYVDPAAWPS